MIKLTPVLWPFFTKAGWRGGRQVAVSAGIPADHPAHEVLQSYGGLHVGKVGEGIDCAASDVRFHVVENDIDPESIGVWSNLLSTTLIGVGDAHHAHEYLFMATDGRVFSLSGVRDAFSFAGDTFDEAMERLLLGRKLQLMLRPDQKEEMHYGEPIKAGDPRLYRFDEE